MNTSNIFFDGKGAIQNMDVEMLKRNDLYDIIPGYSDLKCTDDDLHFVKDILKDFNASQTHFFTLLWIVAYYKKEFYYFMPTEWYDEQEKIKKEQREVDMQMLQKNITKALEKRKKRTEWEEIVMKGNTDTRKTEWKISAGNQAIKDISFTINGEPISTNDLYLCSKFMKLLKKEVLEYKPKIKGLKKTTKKKAIHTLAIERMVNLARLLNQEKVVKNENQVYRLIVKMLGYYEFKVADRQDAVSQVKNTLKKIGFIAIKNSSK